MCRNFGQDEIITVTLVDGGHTFVVSKALLCNSSDYFKKALDGNFKEAKTRTLRLPGCQRQTFEFFLFYLANKTLPDSLNLLGGTDEICISLGKLWNFGDFLIIPAFQNLAMRRILETLKQSSAVRFVRFAYENTADVSPLRRVAIDEMVADFAFRNMDDDEEVFEEMDRLGAIPRLFRDYAIRSADARNFGFGPPSESEDPSEFMVPE